MLHHLIRKTESNLVFSLTGSQDRLARYKTLSVGQLFQNPIERSKQLDNMKAKGSCLCGKSSYTLDGEPALTVFRSDMKAVIHQPNTNTIQPGPLPLSQLPQTYRLLSLHRHAAPNLFPNLQRLLPSQESHCSTPRSRLPNDRHFLRRLRISVEQRGRCRSFRG